MTTGKAAQMAAIRAAKKRKNLRKNNCPKCPSCHEYLSTNYLHHFCTKCGWEDPGYHEDAVDNPHTAVLEPQITKRAKRSDRKQQCESIGCGCKPFGGFVIEKVTPEPKNCEGDVNMEESGDIAVQSGGKMIVETVEEGWKKPPPDNVSKFAPSATRSGSRTHPLMYPVEDEFDSEEEISSGGTFDGDGHDYSDEADDDGDSDDDDEDDDEDEGGSEDDEEENDGDDDESTALPQLPVTFLAQRRNCVNCRRVEPNPGDDIPQQYEMELLDVSVNMIPTGSYRKKFSSLSRDMSGLVTMCRECCTYLKCVPIGQDAIVGTEEMFSWPGFVWCLLTDPRLLEEHEGEMLWKMIPRRWRYWWYYSLTNLHADKYGGITMDTPEPVVTEVSFEKQDLESALVENKLARLAYTVDERLLPVVKCPWGCSEYYHRVGHISIDVVYRLHLGRLLHCYGKLKTRGRHLKGSRRDFLSGHKEFVLENPDWPVLPSIAYIDGVGPCFLSCRFHHGGDKREYFHVPRHPTGTLPSPMSDQLARAVVAPRTVHSTKANTYSHTFQMSKMKGHFDGVDTLRVTDTPRFDTKSVLAKEKEYVTLDNRIDMKTMVEHWKNGEGGPLPSFMAGEMLEAARTYSNQHVDRKSALEGSTMMTLRDVMQLQSDLRTPPQQIVEVEVPNSTSAQGNVQTERIHFRGKYSTSLAWVHPVGSSYGCPFPSLPICMGKALINKCCLSLWLLLAMHVTVSGVWESSCRSIRTDKDWQGWLLTYGSKECFPEKRVTASKMCPFKFERGNRALQVLDKLGDGNKGPSFDPMCFADLFSTNEEVAAFQLQTGANLANDVLAAAAANMDVTTLVVTQDGLAVNTVSGLVNGVSLEAMQSIVAPDESTWELVFIGLSTTGDNPHKWGAEVYARHGDGMFPGWWRQSRKDAFFEQVAELAVDNVARWNICVYVKRSKGNMSGYKEALLVNTLGGQCQAFCEEHNVPLVTAPYDGCGRCSIRHDDESPCPRRVTLECPIDDCRNKLCGVHNDELSGPNRFFVNSDWMDDSDGGSLNAVATNCDDGDSDSDDESFNPADEQDDESGIEGEDLSNATPINEEDVVDFERGGPGCMSFVDDRESYIIDPGECYAGDHSPEFDVLESEDTIAQGIEIPTTDAGRCAPKIKNVGRVVPGHIILNNLGSLLVRRGKKLKGTTAQRNFLQRIVATGEGESLPLAYGEGDLFTGMFWADGGPNSSGAIPGAIPCSLLTDDANMTKQGIATTREHMRSRLSNHSLLASTDANYICYAFDSLTNLGMRGSDSRVVLNRGFLGTELRCGVRMKTDGSNEPLFQTDAVDSRPVVHRLAAAVAEEQATYFYTHTCNQKRHFGVRRLREWLDSEEYIDRLMEKHGRDPESWSQREEIRDSTVAASAVTMLRNWMETCEIYMAYIATSPEEPLGKVKKIWWRHEYQDGVGNLSHIHAMIWLEDEDRCVTEDRIRASIIGLVRTEEEQGLIDEGLVKNQEELDERVQFGQSVLKHTCSPRCKTRVGEKDGEVRCRVAGCLYENPDYKTSVMKDIEVNHSDAALEILADLGMYERDDVTKEWVPIDDAVKAQKHCPSRWPCEGVISPVNGRLFICHQSSDNLQIVTGYNAARYLAKYVAGIDENNKVHIGASRSQPNSYEFDMEFLHNTKVSHSAKNEAERQKKRRDSQHASKGRGISIMEIIALVFGYDQVHTTIKFQNVSTLPLEERPALERHRPLDKLRKEGVVDDQTPDNPTVNDLDVAKVVPSQIVRADIQNLPEWRKHIDTELVMIRDQILSPLSIDSTTAFGVRPPELRFIRSQRLYYKWFVRSKKEVAKTTVKTIEFLRDHVDANYANTTWVDGTNRQIYVREEALPEIVEYMENLSDDDWQCSHSERRAPIRLFQSLHIDAQNPPTSGHRFERWIEHKERFLCDDPRERDIPVVWYNNIRPSQPARFVIHILLSMGKFDNELELLHSGSLRSAMISAKLFDETQPEESMKSLLKRYVKEQLVFMPGSSQQFDRFLVDAKKCFDSVLLRDMLPSNDLPPVLFTSLQANVCSKAEKKVEDNRRRLASACLNYLSKYGSGSLPSLDECMKAKLSAPVPSQRIALQKGQHQSQESHDEQQRANSIIMQAFEDYGTTTDLQVKNIALMGGPGNGKTFVMLLAALRAIAMGYVTTVTAYMSERAQELGGDHLHQLFCLPVREGGCETSVVRMAELALVKLYRKPDKLIYLRRLQVLCIDELGQIPAELLGALDIILRRVRNSSSPFGGLLIVSTMDPLQLPPVRGRPPLLSPHFLTSFRVALLEHSVRASQDPRLQEIQDITRVQPATVTQHIIDRFKMLIKTECTHVSTWQHSAIKQSSLRVFGKKGAVAKAEKDMLAKLRRTPGMAERILHRESVDEESTPEGLWRAATTTTSKLLSRNVKEPKKLCFYPDAIYELTFNKEGCFSQSQVAILLEDDMPTAELIEAFEPVAVMVAPEGTKTIPDGVLSRTRLENEGWKRQMVGVCPEHVSPLQNFGLQGKRKQYGLRHRIAATIHSAMGQNLTSLVTKVTLKDGDYNIWQREQVVVLLSRTNFAKDIIFVGDKDETAEALATILLKRSQYSEYISHLIGQLSTPVGVIDGSGPVALPAVNITRHPYRPVDFELPYDNTGYAYLLGSLKQPEHAYIGETKNLRRRLKQHNSGYGAKQTQSEALRPWALLAFVCGFDGDRSAHQEFETIWKTIRDREKDAGRINTTLDVALLATSAVSRFQQSRQREYNLRVVFCVDMTADLGSVFTNG